MDQVGVDEVRRECRNLAHETAHQQRVDVGAGRHGHGVDAADPQLVHEALAVGGRGDAHAHLVPGVDHRRKQRE